MKYSRPISRLASLAFLSAGVFIAGSVGGSAPASANAIRQIAPIKSKVVDDSATKGRQRADSAIKQQSIIATPDFASLIKLLTSYIRI